MVATQATYNPPIREIGACLADVIIRDTLNPMYLKDKYPVSPLTRFFSFRKLMPGQAFQTELIFSGNFDYIPCNELKIKPTSDADSAVRQGSMDTYGRAMLMTELQHNCCCESSKLNFFTEMTRRANIFLSVVANAADRQVDKLFFSAIEGTVREARNSACNPCDVTDVSFDDDGIPTVDATQGDGFTEEKMEEAVNLLHSSGGNTAGPANLMFVLPRSAKQDFDASLRARNFGCCDDFSKDWGANILSIKGYPLYTTPDPKMFRLIPSVTVDGNTRTNVYFGYLVRSDAIAFAYKRLDPLNTTMMNLIQMDPRFYMGGDRYAAFRLIASMTGFSFDDIMEVYRSDLNSIPISRINGAIDMVTAGVGPLPNHMHSGYIMQALMHAGAMRTGSGGIVRIVLAKN